MPGQAPCWKGRPGPCRGDASDDLGPSLRACGARPSTERPSGDKGACLASPGMAWKAVFSEGRTPCVRLAWPNVCRGIPFSRDGRAKPGDPWGHASIKRELSLRACGARTSPARPSEVRGLGGKIRNHAKGRFFWKGPVSASALGAE